MTRDEIIRMAREVGAWDYYEINGDKYSDYSPLEKFAVLVAAAEREACAEVCDANGEVYLAELIRERGEK